VPVNLRLIYIIPSLSKTASEPEKARTNLGESTKLADLTDVRKTLQEPQTSSTPGVVVSLASDVVSMRRQVLRLALPAIGEQVLNMMVSMVDTILVGQFGAPALAAASLASE
jgi:hypothetical protein